MSRIGRKAITLPTGVTCEVTADHIVVKGPKGQLQVPALKGIKIAVQEGQIKVDRSAEDKQARANHGLIRSLLNNSVTGVNTGYKKTLKLVGTGYRVSMKGAGLSLAIGFSHPVDIVAPAGIKLTIEGNDTIFIEGIDINN
jgi:large subunit ribosomal protein L6